MSKRLLPAVPTDLVVDQVLPTPDHITVLCRSRIPAPVCPGCGYPSSRRHSSYPRRLADLPLQGRRVQVRRLRCGRPGCAHRIFAERLPAVAGPYAQRTARLGSLQHHPGVEVIARDRGAGYADGGRRSAPGAVHVADRWHLLENRSAAVLEAVKRNTPALRAAARPAGQPTSSVPIIAAATMVPAADPDAPPTMTSAQRLQWQRWQRRMQVHGDVMRLHQKGVSVRHCQCRLYSPQIWRLKIPQFGAAAVHP